MTIDDSGGEERTRDWHLIEPANGIELALSAVPHQPVDRAGRFAVSVTFAGAPAGAGLDVAIIRDAVPGRYAESGGSLTLRPVPVEGNGAAQFDFIGSAVSAPDDLPAFFPVDAGRYRLVATLINHRHSIHGWSIGGPKTVVLARIVSDSFVLTGTPDLRQFAHRIRSAFETRLSEGLALYAPGVSLERYYIEHAPDFSAAQISVRYEMMPPFAGTFVAQLPAALASEEGVRLPSPEQIVFKGKIGFGNGIVSHRLARKAAIEAFGVRVAGSGGTAADAYTTGWIYRRDQQAWYFQAACRGAGDDSGARALVSVTRDGAASILEYRPFGERLSTDLFHEPDPWSEPTAIAPARPGQSSVSPGLVSGKLRLNDVVTGLAPPAAAEIEPLAGHVLDGARIIALGAYEGGIATRFTIADESQPVGSIRISADSDGPPVVLVLTGYSPILWDLRAVPRTRLRAVLVFSHHRHAVAGLEEAVPIHFASRNDSDRPGAGIHAHEGGEMLDRLAATVTAFTGRPIDAFHGGYAPETFRLDGTERPPPYAGNIDDPDWAAGYADWADGLRHPDADPIGPAGGGAMIGDPGGPGSIAIRADVPVTFAAVAPREAGIRQLLAEGAIRPATELDWICLSAALTRASPTGHLARVPVPRLHRNAYVVLRAITIPKGMHGAHAAAFLIAKGVPHPTDAGSHNVYYPLDESSR